MNAIQRIFILLPVILLMVGQSSCAQTAEELMPLAIQLEEVNGELEKAIEVYQVIIEKYPENKPFAAKAYFHMGMCYEKLGKQEQLLHLQIALFQPLRNSYNVLHYL